MHLVNKEGHAVDKEGRLIDETGRYIDSEGNYIAYRLLTECYNEPTYMCQGEIYDSFISDEGKIVFSGMSYFTNVN